MRTLKTRILLLLALLATGAEAKDWYAAPGAGINGDGSKGNPWSLFAALQKSNIAAGDTLYLRGGNYRGPGFVSNLTGTSNGYITVRSQPGEWAVVTDGLMGVLQTNLPANAANILNVPIAGLEMLPTLPVFMIGSETIYTVGRTGTNWNLVRAWNGSQVTAHAAGDPVLMAKDIIQHDGSYVIFRDFEITTIGSANRTVGISNYLGSGLNLSSLGHGNKAVNLIVHNTGHPGIGFWQQGAGAEINGCVIWGTGQYDWSSNFRGEPRGSAIYAQNNGGLAVVKNCITFANFTSGGKVFGETAPVMNFQFVSNITFRVCCDVTLAASSGSTTTSNIWLNGNLMMGHPQLSYVSRSNRAEYFINNTVVDGYFTVSEHADSVYTNNTVFMLRTPNYGGAPILYESSCYYKSNLNLVWDHNNYYVGNSNFPSQWGWRTKDGTAFNSQGGGILEFQNDATNSWKDWSGFDVHSKYLPTWPTNYLHVSVQQTDYDSNRWHVAVVSTSGQTNAAILLSDFGFASGEHYQLVDVQNWPVVIASGTYAGGALNLPLNLTNVSSLPGITHFNNEHTNVKNPGLFNTFVLLRPSSLLPPTNLRVLPQ